jgi:hypothetical protein
VPAPTSDQTLFMHEDESTSTERSYHHSYGDLPLTPAIDLPNNGRDYASQYTPISIAEQSSNDQRYDSDANYENNGEHYQVHQAFGQLTIEEKDSEESEDPEDTKELKRRLKQVDSKPGPKPDKVSLVILVEES